MPRVNGTNPSSPMYDRGAADAATAPPALAPRMTASPRNAPAVTWTLRYDGSE